MIDVIAFLALLILSGVGLCLLQLKKTSDKVNAISVKLDAWERDLAAGLEQVTSGATKKHSPGVLGTMPDVGNDGDFSRE